MCFVVIKLKDVKQAPQLYCEPDSSRAYWRRRLMYPAAVQKELRQLAAETIARVQGRRVPKGRGDSDGTGPLADKQ